MNIKRFRVLFALSALCWSASATTIVVGYSKSKIVIAADSRLSKEDGTYQDTSCKIAALSDQFLFASSGRAVDVTNHKLGWDVAQLAKDALTDVSKRKPNAARPFAGDVADLWQDLVGQNISNNIRSTEFARLVPNQTFVNGVFLGLGPAGDVQGAFAVLTRSADPKFMIYTPPLTVLEPLETMKFGQQGGENELFDEFAHATTPRGRAELAITYNLEKDWRPEEAEVRLAIRLVELIIKYDTDSYVGGAVDAVELDKGGTVHWIQRKSNCGPAPLPSKVGDFRYGNLR